MPTIEQIREAIDALLDHGVHPVSVLRILAALLCSGSELAESVIDQEVGEQTRKRLSVLESRMAELAAEGSWTRLGQVLATYQQLTQ